MADEQEIGGAAQANNQLQATAMLSQIPFGAIIGSPLKAAVDAQAAAAVACYDFIRNVGFVNGNNAGNAGANEAADGMKVRDVTFVFERQTNPVPVAENAVAPANAPKTQISVTVPLLTIMPLPFIRIDSMTVNFKASISAVDDRSLSQSTQTNKELKGEATLGFGWWKVNASGGVSSKKDSTATNTSKYSVEHTIDVSVHAVQDDMPAGLAKILSIMNESISLTRG